MVWPGPTGGRAWSACCSPPASAGLARCEHRRCHAAQGGRCGCLGPAGEAAPRRVPEPRRPLRRPARDRDKCIFNDALTGHDPGQRRPTPACQPAARLVPRPSGADSGSARSVARRTRLSPDPTSKPYEVWKTLECRLSRSAAGCQALNNIICKLRRHHN